MATAQRHLITLHESNPTSPPPLHLKGKCSLISDYGLPAGIPRLLRLCIEPARCFWIFWNFSMFKFGLWRDPANYPCTITPVTLDKVVFLGHPTQMLPSLFPGFLHTWAGLETYLPNGRIYAWNLRGYPLLGYCACTWAARFQENSRRDMKPSITFEPVHMNIFASSYRVVLLNLTASTQDS
jgi:hypothetical protein